MLDLEIDRLRRFERFYERRLRTMRRALTGEDFKTGDIKVIHELGQAGSGSGAWLAGQLALDEGYLCRVLKKLEAYRLVVSRPSATDGRMRDWELTKGGQAFADRIEKGYRERARENLLVLRDEERSRLVEALALVESLLARC